MPYKVEKTRLPQHLDRRVKLLDEDKDEIRKLYKSGLYSLNGLAKQYSVSKKTILLIVNPQSKEKNDRYIKEHWMDYKQDKEQHNLSIKKTRRYKQDLRLKGEI